MDNYISGNLFGKIAVYMNHLKKQLNEKVADTENEKKLIIIKRIISNRKYASIKITKVIKGNFYY